MTVPAARQRSGSGTASGRLQGWCTSRFCDLSPLEGSAPKAGSQLTCAQCCPEEEVRRRAGEGREWGAQPGSLGPVCGLLFSSSSWASSRVVQAGQERAGAVPTPLYCPRSAPPPHYPCLSMQHGGQNQPRRTLGSDRPPALPLLASTCLPFHTSWTRNMGSRVRASEPRLLVAGWHQGHPGL